MQTNTTAAVKTCSSRPTFPNDSHLHPHDFDTDDLIGITIHMCTRRAKRPVRDAISPIKYEVSALHMDPYALNVNAGTIGQCVATQGHHPKASQTWATG